MQQEIGAGRRILVIRQPGDMFERSSYVIHLLMEQWREWGFAVEVSSNTDSVGGADTVIIPHLDVTRIPAKYVTSFMRSAVVVNRGVVDISKRKISDNLVREAREHDGPVLVKTDRNCKGQAEMARARNKGRLARAVFAVARLLPWELTGMIGEYKIYDHSRFVPRAVWHNPSLVVEKFLPERQDGLFCLRQYTFFGSSEINTIVFSAEPIVKARNVIRRQVLDEPSPGVRNIRNMLGFDYGKFDYVLQDGRAVLLDANRTPTYDASSAAGTVKPLIIGLARGIHAFFR
jgi:hypothetical protein